MGVHVAVNQKIVIFVAQKETTQHKDEYGRHHHADRVQYAQALVT